MKQSRKSGFGHIFDSSIGWLAATRLNPTITLGKGGMTWWKEVNVNLGLFYKSPRKYKTGKNYVDAWKKNTTELFTVYTWLTSNF